MASHPIFIASASADVAPFVDELARRLVMGREALILGRELSHLAPQELRREMKRAKIFLFILGALEEPGTVRTRLELEIAQELPGVRVLFVPASEGVPGAQDVITAPDDDLGELLDRERDVHAWESPAHLAELILSASRRHEFIHEPVMALLQEVVAEDAFEFVDTHASSHGEKPEEKTTSEEDAAASPGEYFPDAPLDRVLAPELLTRRRLMKGPKPFEAHPRLEAPATATPGQEFEVVVGFRPDLDPGLLQEMPIRISAPTPGEPIFVVLTGENLAIQGDTIRKIALDANASAKFRASILPGQDHAVVNASYVYLGRVVGFASRIVRTAESGAAEKDAPPIPLKWVEPEDAPDATIQITKKGGTQIDWYLITTQRVVGPFASLPQDAKRFARESVKKLEETMDGTKFAVNTLNVVARDIAQHVPKPIQKEITGLARTLGRPPSILLLTQELYVPWELAALDDPPDPSAPNILGAQANVGRWILDGRVAPPPPAVVRVRNISAIASEYGGATGQGMLKSALMEQAHLRDAHQAMPVDAKKTTILKLIDPATPNHLLHFAVHGANVVGESDATLILADPDKLTAEELAGDPDPSDPPSACFVFLNACQVGAANDGLGQATGFPGRLLEARVEGFLAPLWKVKDEVAHDVAVVFYKEAFSGTSAGEILRKLRASYDKAKSLTLLAYVYYGHPKLRLSRLN